MMCEASKELGIHRMRTKYLDVAHDNMAYVKQRHHTNKRTRRMIRRQLDLLGKILKELRRLDRENPCAGIFSDKQLAEIETITKIYRQQHKHHESGNAKESIPNRIVSVNKPYIRPIVRGKEVKKVEFGAKCNNIQVDGLSFIEKLSFNAFNEGTRLVHCVKLAEKLFGEKITKLAGDCSYSGNANRSFCSEQNIVTSFSQKGRKRENTSTVSMVKKELARVRATAMEGSFGTQKEHYGLKRISGRIKKTEILIIFFGIHTANAVQLARRIAKKTAAVKLDFSSPETIAGYYMQDLRGLDKEHLILVLLDNKCCRIRDCIISVGTVNASLVNPREIFMEALKYGASSIILLHNHPSGDETPSRNDILVTKRVAEAGEIMGIHLLDHIIIGDNKYTSLKEKEYM